MTITLGDLLNEVKHASGSPRASQFVSQISIVQQAGDYLDSMHSWDGMVLDEVTLATVAGASYIDLPSDVRDIITIQHNEGTTNWFKFVTHERMTRLRAYDDDDQDYVGGYYAARFMRQTTDGPVASLRIYPEPAATAANQFLMCYRARSVPIGLGSESDTTYLSIPEYLEGLLRRVVRIFARSIEEEDDGVLEARLEGLEASQFLMRIKERDGSMQPDIGQISGGAAQVRAYENHWWDTAVEDPS